MSPGRPPEFSSQTRQADLARLAGETFDLLIVGGGITGAAVARDAVTRGLKVALVEKSDFASGTSSRSSKLIHGGLRYLENFEWKLVFEALSERSFLLKSAPNLVRPLPFYLPVYEGDAHGRGILDLGLWLYDLLALFRAPGAHKRLSARAMREAIPFLKDGGLRGGFHYYDASMWDDRLVIETLRSARELGAVVVNYVEARAPLADWQGMQVRPVSTPGAPDLPAEFPVRASQVIVCGGPWTDLLGQAVAASEWHRWLTPSKGVHLVFDLKRLPIPGAMVMSHPEDGRISFVIPRPDMGQGITIVGTTDSPTHPEPERARIEREDVAYLMSLLEKYFPALQLTTSDILSAYVGVRPLVGANPGAAPGDSSAQLQKVSREHHIGWGPGGSVWAAGGKYTTHRTMGQEIVDFALERREWVSQLGTVGRSDTRTPVNPRVLPEAVARARAAETHPVAESLWALYGAEAREIAELDRQALGKSAAAIADPVGFPCLRGQLLHALKYGAVLRLEDFWFRRAPLYLALPDQGEAWVDALAEVWAHATGGDAPAEAALLRAAIARESAWKREL